MAAHPEIELNLDSSAALVDFAGGRFDGALRYGPGTWPDLAAERLFGEWLAPVASPALLAGRPRPRLETLGDWPLPSNDDPRPRWFERCGGREPARNAASFSDVGTQHRAALEGVGVALGRMTMLEPLLAAGRLVALFDECLPARHACCLVHPARSQRHAGFAAFRRWLPAEVAGFRASPPPRRPAAAA